MNSYIKGLSYLNFVKIKPIKFVLKKQIYLMIICTSCIFVSVEVENKRILFLKIIDVYDFNKWKYISEIVSCLCGTNDFDIEIYGLVEDGAFQ